MTDSRHDPFAAREELDRFRNDFGHQLLSATRERERVRRRLVAPLRRRAAIGMVAAAAVLVVTALPVPGERDAPLLGASPAEAAIRELRDSLQTGVLIRRAVVTQHGRGVERRTVEDWTDLSTREQRTRITAADPNANAEFWNPSKHERWSRNGALRAADGRPVIEHTLDRSSANSSSSQSPIEEVDELLAQARRGDLVVRRSTTKDGAKRLVLERRDECYATRDNGVAECPDPAKPSRWPHGGSANMRPVTMFATWWLKEGDAPQIVRHENGFVTRGSTNREVVVRIRYTRWDVLPATAEALSLVRPPVFPANQFLVIDGRNAVRKALEEGKANCRGEFCR